LKAEQRRCPHPTQAGGWGDLLPDGGTHSRAPLSAVAGGAEGARACWAAVLLRAECGAGRLGHGLLAHAGREEGEGWAEGEGKEERELAQRKKPFLFIKNRFSISFLTQN